METSELVEKFRETLNANGHPMKDWSSDRLASHLFAEMQRENRDWKAFGDDFTRQIQRIETTPKPGRKGFLGAFKEIPAGARSAWERKKGSYKAFAGGAGGALGFDEFEDDMMLAQRRNMERAHREGPSITNIDMVAPGNWGSIGRWFLGVGAEATVDGLEILGSIFAGGAAGKMAAGKRGVEVADDIKEKVKKAEMLGAGLAGVGTSTVQNTGQVYSELYPYTQLPKDHKDYLDPGDARAMSFGAGFASGMLDSAVPLALFRSFSKKVGREAASEAIGKMLKKMPANMVILPALGEAGTEAMQEVVQMLTVKSHTGEEWGENDWSRLRNAGAMGFVGGGVLGGGVAAVGSLTSRELPSDTSTAPELAEIESKRRELSRLRAEEIKEDMFVVRPGTRTSGRVVENEGNGWVKIMDAEGKEQRLRADILVVRDDLKAKKWTDSELEKLDDEQLDYIKSAQPDYAKKVNEIQAGRKVGKNKIPDPEDPLETVPISEDGLDLKFVKGTTKFSIQDGGGRSLATGELVVGQDGAIRFDNLDLIDGAEGLRQKFTDLITDQAVLYARKNFHLLPDGTVPWDREYLEDPARTPAELRKIWEKVNEKTKTLVAGDPNLDKWNGLKDILTDRLVDSKRIFESGNGYHVPDSDEEAQILAEARSALDEALTLQIPKEEVTNKVREAADQASKALGNLTADQQGRAKGKALKGLSKLFPAWQKRKWTEDTGFEPSVENQKKAKEKQTDAEKNNNKLVSLKKEGFELNKFIFRKKTTWKITDVDDDGVVTLVDRDGNEEKVGAAKLSNRSYAAKDTWTDKEGVRHVRDKEKYWQEHTVKEDGYLPATFIYDPEEKAFTQMIEGEGEDKSTSNIRETERSELKEYMTLDYSPLWRGLEESEGKYYKESSTNAWQNRRVTYDQKKSEKRFAELEDKSNPQDALVVKKVEYVLQSHASINAVGFEVAGGKFLIPEFKYDEALEKASPTTGGNKIVAARVLPEAPKTADDLQGGEIIEIADDAKIALTSGFETKGILVDKYQWKDKLALATGHVFKKGTGGTGKRKSKKDPPPPEEKVYSDSLNAQNAEREVSLNDEFYEVEEKGEYNKTDIARIDEFLTDEKARKTKNKTETATRLTQGEGGSGRAIVLQNEKTGEVHVRNLIGRGKETRDISIAGFARVRHGKAPEPAPFWKSRRAWKLSQKGGSPYSNLFSFPPGYKLVGFLDAYNSGDKFKIEENFKDRDSFDAAVKNIPAPGTPYQRYRRLKAAGDTQDEGLFEDGEFNPMLSEYSDEDLTESTKEWVALMRSQLGDIKDDTNRDIIAKILLGVESGGIRAFQFQEVHQRISGKMPPAFWQENENLVGGLSELYQSFGPGIARGSYQNDLDRMSNDPEESDRLSALKNPVASGSSFAESTMGEMLAEYGTEEEIKVVFEKIGIDPKYVDDFVGLDLTDHGSIKNFTDTVIAESESESELDPDFLKIRLTKVLQAYVAIKKKGAELLPKEPASVPNWFYDKEKLHEVITAEDEITNEEFRDYLERELEAILGIFKKIRGDDRVLSKLDSLVKDVRENKTDGYTIKLKEIKDSLLIWPETGTTGGASPVIEKLKLVVARLFNNDHHLGELFAQDASNSGASFMEEIVNREEQDRNRQKNASDLINNESELSEHAALEGGLTTMDSKQSRRPLATLSEANDISSEEGIDATIEAAKQEGTRSVEAHPSVLIKDEQARQELVEENTRAIAQFVEADGVLDGEPHIGSRVMKRALDLAKRLPESKNKQTILNSLRAMNKHPLLRQVKVFFHTWETYRKETQFRQGKYDLAWAKGDSIHMGDMYKLLPTDDFSAMEALLFTLAEEFGHTITSQVISASNTVHQTGKLPTGWPRGVLSIDELRKLHQNSETILKWLREANDGSFRNGLKNHDELWANFATNPAFRDWVEQQKDMPDTVRIKLGGKIRRAYDWFVRLISRFIGGSNAKSPNILSVLDGHYKDLLAMAKEVHSLGSGIGALTSQLEMNFDAVKNAEPEYTDRDVTIAAARIIQWGADENIGSFATQEAKKGVIPAGVLRRRMYELNQLFWSTPRGKRDAMKARAYRGDIKFSKVHSSERELGEGDDLTFSSLPEIPKDHIRLIHQTSDDLIETVKTDGLKWKHNLGNTAHPLSSMDQLNDFVDAQGNLKEFTAGGHTMNVVVMDVPMDVYDKAARPKRYTKEDGTFETEVIIDPKYFVAKVSGKKAKAESPALEASTQPTHSSERELGVPQRSEWEASVVNGTVEAGAAALNEVEAVFNNFISTLSAEEQDDPQNREAINQLRRMANGHTPDSLKKIIGKKAITPAEGIKELSEYVNADKMIQDFGNDALEDAAARMFFRLAQGYKARAEITKAKANENRAKAKQDFEEEALFFSNFSRKSLFDQSKAKVKLHEELARLMSKKQVDRLLVTMGEVPSLYAKEQSKKIDADKLYDVLTSIIDDTSYNIEEVATEDAYRMLQLKSEDIGMDEGHDNLARAALAVMLASKNSAGREYFTISMRVSRNRALTGMDKDWNLVERMAREPDFESVPVEGYFSSRLEDIRDRRRRLKEKQEAMDLNASKVAVGEKIASAFSERIEELRTFFGETPPVALYHGAEIKVLTRVEQDGEEVLKEELFEYRTADGSKEDEAHQKDQMRRASELFQIVESEQFEKEYGDQPGLKNYFIELANQLQLAPMANLYEYSHLAFRLGALQSFQKVFSRVGPHGNAISAALNKMNREYTMNLPRITAQGQKVSRTLSNLHRVMSPDDKLPTFLRGFYNKVFHWFNENPDLLGDDKASRKLWNELKDTGAYGYNYSEENFKYFKAMISATEVQNNQLRDLSRKLGLSIKDDELAVNSLITGRPDKLYRREIDQGVMTVTRMLNADTLKEARSVLIPEETKDKRHNLFKQARVQAEKAIEASEADPSAPSPRKSIMAMLDKLFADDQILEHFLDPFLTEVGAHSEIWKVTIKGKNILISPERLRDTWQKQTAKTPGSKLASFIEDISGAESDGDYVEAAMDILDQLSHRAQLVVNSTNNIRKHEDEKTRNPMRIIYGADIDSSLNGRSISSLLPQRFLQYAAFDEVTSRILLGKIIQAANFGRNGEKIEEEFNALTQAPESKLKKARDRYASIATAAGLQHMHPDGRKDTAWTKEERKRILATGKVKNWKEFEEVVKRANLLSEVKDSWAGLQQFMNDSEGWRVDNKAGMEALTTIAFGAVNQMKTSFTAPMSIGDIVKRLGLNPTALRAVGESVTDIPRQIAGTFLERFGMTMAVSEYEEMLVPMFQDLTQSLSVNERISDIGSGGELHSTGIEAPFRRYLRKGRKLISTAGGAKNRAKLGGGKFVAGSMRTALTTPFSYISNVVNKSISLSIIRMIDRRVRNAAHVLDSMEISNTDKSIELTSDQLGFKDTALDRWVTGSKDMIEWLNNRLVAEGMSLTAMAQDFRRRRDKDPNALPLTQDGVIASWQIAMSEITYDAVTGKPILTSKGKGKFIAPLLNWSLSSLSQGLDQMRNKDGKIALRESLRYMLVSTAWLMPIGVALTLWTDWWDEEILGKPSNLRKVPPVAGLPVIGLPLAMTDPRWNTFAMIERAARASNVFGLGQEAMSQMMGGFDTSAPYRQDYSRRILALGATLNIATSMKNYIMAVDLSEPSTLEPDYSQVIRPLAFSLGLNGLLQHAQAATNIFPRLAEVPGLSHERRVSNIIGMRNTLRAHAKVLGMEMRSSKGFSIMPTPISVAIRRMERSAYANDTEDFLEAYREAIILSKSEDPYKDVKDKFKTRNIKNGITQYSMSDQDWITLLSVLDDDERVKIQDAVTSHNYYLSLIGGTPRVSKKMTTQYSNELRSLALH